MVSVAWVCEDCPAVFADGLAAAAHIREVRHTVEEVLDEVLDEVVEDDG